MRLLGSVAVLVVVMLGACNGKDGVEYRAGSCWVGDHVASLQEVERHQAQVAERMQARQPWSVLVTILVVVLAGLSHIEKLVLLFSTRKGPSQGLGDRIRLALDRYRVHPFRYFALVSATLALLLLAGGFYIFLDADRRASERALAQLQFCHLALRSGDEHRALDEQRKNLEAIAATAGSIHDLVDRMPPEEREKAKQIVTEINSALAKQGHLVGDFLAKTTSMEQAAQLHGTIIERGLGEIASSLAALRPMTASLQDLRGALKQLDGKVDNVDRHTATVEDRLRSLEQAVQALRTRRDPGLRTDGGVP